MELTYQMYPVKDVDSFVKAMAECFSDPAPWGIQAGRKSRITTYVPGDDRS